ncbi:DUF5776 domain-containing protein [Lentilactobacillus sp. SPB1-3]|uniref:DUF5776 domain-containing protein n=1 Tax=Lentilactobacillus terminaliae TaxID=3003483 RepID=A0ACD5DHP1_9LACO|nr:DUF5776 domain-containing protein [Lentilactobacillus sp. SPB1-3]MCZ0977625.1 DUF5776 domain-containing protein [Lentilactobacillus sp. SPB1-3]
MYTSNGIKGYAMKSITKAPTFTVVGIDKNSAINYRYKFINGKYITANKEYISPNRSTVHGVKIVNAKI